MRRNRGLTGEELALWHHAVRDTAPLRPTETVPQPLPPVPPKAAMPAPQEPVRAVALPTRPPTARRLDPTGPVDLDRRSWLKLRRGSYPIDARIDLHGMTQVQAHTRLTSFLAGAQARGNRCVLIITGRGLRHGGTLREMTPRWLETEPTRGIVLSFAQAHLHHGGEGALYVLLRRRPGR
jgi:DNA-nicking Smr family endonuclease